MSRDDETVSAAKPVPRL